MKKLFGLISTGILISLTVFSCATTPQDVKRFSELENQLKNASSTVNDRILDSQTLKARISKVVDSQDITEPVVHDAISEVIQPSSDLSKITPATSEELIGELISLDEGFFVSAERPVVSVTKASSVDSKATIEAISPAPESSSSTTPAAKPTSAVAATQTPSATVKPSASETASEEKKPSTSYAVFTSEETVPSTALAQEKAIPAVEPAKTNTVSDAEQPKVAQTESTTKAATESVTLTKTADQTKAQPSTATTSRTTAPATTPASSAASTKTAAASAASTATVSAPAASTMTATTASAATSTAPAASTIAATTVPASTSTTPASTVRPSSDSAVKPAQTAETKSTGTATTVAKKKTEETKTADDTTEQASKSEKTEKSDSSASKQKSTGNKKKATPSRSVTMGKSQYLDITYPGNGWIYLGENDDKALMRYFGRKLGDEDTSFTMRSREEGTTVLHFYKNDPLTGTFLDDYLEVVITGENMDGTRVTAPEYAAVIPGEPSIYATMTKPYPEGEFVEIEPEVITLPPLNPVSVAETVDPEAETSQENSETASGSTESATTDSTEATATAETAETTAEKPAESSSEQPSQTANVDEDSKVTTVIQNTTDEEDEFILPITSEPARPTDGTRDAIIGSTSTILENEISSYTTDELLKLAKQAYKSKKYDQALNYLHEFFNTSVTRIDEGLFLQGQVLEANSSVRDIKGALDSYQTLVKNYPASEDWQAANERIIYINRFYFNKR